MINAENKETPEEFLKAETQSLSQWHKDYENDTQLVHEVSAIKFARLKSAEDNKELVEMIKRLMKYPKSSSAHHNSEMIAKELIAKHTNNNPQ